MTFAAYAINVIGNYNLMQRGMPIRSTSEIKDIYFSYQLTF